MSVPGSVASLIPLTRPSLGPAEEEAVLEVLRSGWLTQGRAVAEFERRFAVYVGAGHAVAVTSCTTALHLALLVSGVGPGDEVICPSHTFVATANVIRHCGATPVFVDIRPDLYTVDPAAVEAAVTPRTRAVMPVHQAVPADLDEIRASAVRHGLPIIEDAAPAIGCEYRGQRIGGGGNLACFSFHPRKIITTGEGGMITTDDAVVAARLRRLRHHGMSLSDFERHGEDRVVYEEYLEVGYNYRMTDIQAAVGIVQLGRLDEILGERRRLAARYDAGLRASTPWLLPPSCPTDRTHSYQSYIARLAAGAPVGQVELLGRLAAAGIAAKRGIMCCHREPAYRDAAVRWPLDESERAMDECVMLPLFPGMTRAEQDRVLDVVQAAASVARGA